jgi:hypothetical protein
MHMLYPETISGIVELGATVGLIASCLLLYRFFRGGIMEQSFIIFSIGSVLFFMDRSITILVLLGLLPSGPFTEIHLIMETIFVILFTLGFLLLYKNWMSIQRRVPQRDTLSPRLA